MFFLPIYKCRIFDKPAVLDSFCSLTGIPFPFVQLAQNEVVYYAICSVCVISGIAGERIRGNSLVATIRAVLHTGQRQGFIPVSLAKRSTLVSGSCCFLIIASISVFFPALLFAAG